MKKHKSFGEKVHQWRLLGKVNPVTVMTPDAKTESGRVYIQNWDAGQRLNRSLRIFGVFLGLSLVSIFIPRADFLLVPGFLVAALLAAAWVHRQKSAVLGGESTCPECSNTLPLAEGRDIWPLHELCGFCQTRVTIVKVEMNVGNGKSESEKSKRLYG